MSYGYTIASFLIRSKMRRIVNFIVLETFVNKKIKKTSFNRAVPDRKVAKDRITLFLENLNYTL